MAALLLAFYKLRMRAGHFVQRFGEPVLQLFVFGTVRVERTIDVNRLEYGPSIGIDQFAGLGREQFSNRTPIYLEPILDASERQAEIPKIHEDADSQVRGQLSSNGHGTFSEKTGGAFAPPGVIRGRFPVADRAGGSPRSS